MVLGPHISVENGAVLGASAEHVAGGPGEGGDSALVTLVRSEQFLRVSIPQLDNAAQCSSGEVVATLPGPANRGGCIVTRVVLMQLDHF